MFNRFKSSDLVLSCFNHIAGVVIHTKLISSLTVFFSLAGIVTLNAQRINTDSLKQILQHQTGPAKVKTLIALGGSDKTIGLDSAFHYARKAFQLAQEINDAKSIISSEYQLSALYATDYQDSLAYKHIRHALDLALSEQDDYLITEGNLELARYYRYTHQVRKSVEILSPLINAPKHKYTKKHLARIYEALGSSYRSLGLHQNSISNFLEALKIYEGLNDRKAIALALDDIGTIYQRTGDFDDALTYFNRSLKLNEANGDDEGVSDNLLNIGVIHQKKGNYEEALNYYNKALTSKKALRDTATQAILIGNIGSTLRFQGKLKESLKYLSEALALKKKKGELRSMIHTFNNISETKYLLNDGAGAREAAEEAVRLSIVCGDTDYLRYGYLNLSKSYKLMRNSDRALFYLERYNAINDSLYNLEKAEQINKMQIQYDTEKKDQAITALQQEKEIANSQRKIYFLVGFIVLLIAVGLYINQRLKNRRNLQLLEKEKEVDRLKSNFFANISHEFRTPLSLILGPIDSLLEKIDEADNRYHLGLMKKSASRLLRLVNQILELSKLESGYVELKVREFNAVELITGVTSTFQSLADSRDIQLEIESSHPEIMVYADQGHIETICINLLSNAFKFSDSGGRITVCLDKVDATSSKTPYGFVELQVIDTGVGISPEQASHIFDRFYRAGSASTSQYGGTGIGLALTKELVDAHSGTIQVTSDLGVGTSVTVRLPLGKDHFRAEQLIKDDSSIQKTQENKLTVPLEHSQPELIPNDEETEAEEEEKPMVLLIEDNEDVRTYIKSILTSKYMLIEAADGRAGINQAKAFIPDLIISDVMMPNMNGYEATKALKLDERTSHIPVILLTAKASISSRIEGLEKEADLYLNKPFVPQELILSIHNLIQSRKKLREKYNRQVVLKPSEITVNSIDEQFLKRLLEILEVHYSDENFSVDQLSKEIGMSRSQLHRKLKALTNEPTSQFIRSFRLQRAMDLLQKKYASVSEIAYKVGFSSPPYFQKCFLQQYGRTPSTIMNHHA